MTATLDHTAVLRSTGADAVPAARAAAAPTGPATTPSGRIVLDHLVEVCAAVAELDPDALGDRTTTGRLLRALAEVARRASAELGRDAGTALGPAPGVVVLRDLAAATRQLERAVAQTGGSRVGHALVAESSQLRAAIRERLTPAA